MNETRRGYSDDEPIPYRLTDPRPEPLLDGSACVAAVAVLICAALVVIAVAVAGFGVV